MHIVDLHADTPMMLRLGRDIRVPHRRLPAFANYCSHVDVPALKKGEVIAQGWGLWSLPFESARSSGMIEKQMRAVEKALESSEDLIMVRTGSDIRRAAENDQTGIFLGLEGAHCLHKDTAKLAGWARRGVRYITLAHFVDNYAVSPAYGRGACGKGLTNEGHELLDEAERLGVLIDLAHVEKNAFMDVCRKSTKPVIVSHTGVSGVHEHWRNIDDEQIRAVADTGGAVGIMFAPRFLGADSTEAVVKHILHVSDVGGTQATCIGSDFDGMVKPVRDLADAACFQALVHTLDKAGARSDLIEAVARLNALRVLDE